MARRREVDPRGTYHVTSRGNYRQPIFVDDDHYEHYLKMLTTVSRKYEWLVLDWCLLPNHFHLVLRLLDDGLSDGMRELNGGFSRWTNRIHGRTGTGHLVRNRFGAKPIKSDEHMLEVCRYVPLNPVRAGLVERAEDWPWSGYRATLGLEDARIFHSPDLVLRLFHSEPTEARSRLADWVESGHAELRRLWGQTRIEAQHPLSPRLVP
jgi:putative transposase